jgi:hypothetical protein
MNVTFSKLCYINIQEIKMKKNIIMLTMLVILILTFGCSRAEPQAEYLFGESANFSRTTAYFSADTPMLAGGVMLENDSIHVEEAGSSDSANLTNTERKLIKRAFLRIRVDNLNAADASITSLLDKYNAYTASTEAEENSRYYSLRVPSSLYDAFLAEINGMGRLIHRSESTEDVTLRYYDLEGRLEMKRMLLRTFQSYLTRARTIEEILSVEARIAELQNDIEGTGVQLRHLANRIDYASIDLSLLGPVTLTQTQNITLVERIKKLFGSFGNFLSTVVVIIISIIIFGIPLVLLLALLFWILFGKIGLLRKLWKKVTTTP